MEEFKFHAKVNQPIKDWETTPITTKMEVLSKLIAGACFEEQKKMGGDSYKFTISGIYDKKTNEQHGDVVIEWKMAE